jgi:hypothetical protein
MTINLTELAEVASKLSPGEFREFLRRVAEARVQRGLPAELDDASLRQEDGVISQIRNGVGYEMDTKWGRGSFVLIWVVLGSIHGLSR